MKIQTGKADLHLGQLEVGIDANEGAGLQGQGEAVGQRIPVPVLQEQHHAHAARAPEVAAR